MDKFEPLLDNLLSEQIRTDSDQLIFQMSRLNLNDHKTKVFEVLTELYYCDCCNKHQLNKPCIPVKWVSTKTPTQSVITCECDCRHTARMICRMCD